MLDVDPADPDPGVLARAGEALRTGRLVAFPTETVYGLGAHALDGDAVGRIFAAKGRPPDNPLIVHIAGADDLGTVTETVTPLARRLAERFWPGPLTLVLRAAVSVPADTRGGLATVAVRVPDHPVARGVIGAAGVPVAAPSANRSGRPSPTTAAHVRRDLGDVVDLIVDGGPCAIGLESTVVDARGDEPIVLREGAVTREDLEVGTPQPGPEPPDAAASPGTRYRHYAPDCRVILVPPDRVGDLAATHAAQGEQIGVVVSDPAAELPEGVEEVATFGDAEHLARILYDVLRSAESRGLEVLIVEAVEEEGIGRAVMDRLRRAAADGP